MTFLVLFCGVAAVCLSSCDHIDAVGDKVNELKDVRKQSSQGVEGMDIKAIVSGAQNAGPTVQDIGEVDFQTFISQPGRLNVVDFHADWCGPCKQLAPVLSGVIETNSTVARLGKLNVDHARELSREQGVTSIPDVRFYVDGKLVHKFVGGESKETLETLIATHSANISPAGGGGDAIPGRPRPPNAKHIEEAMKPMEKEWLPPGMIKK
ncbi:thioredoxin family protein [Akkermansiaceae bacterium]|nr:thioredoxin family protein [Akkermansiaceae bacterium]